MQVGVADAAMRHFDQHLGSLRLRGGQLNFLQRRSVLDDGPGAHGLVLCSATIAMDNADTGRVKQLMQIPHCNTDGTASYSLDPRASLREGRRLPPDRPQPCGTQLGAATLDPFAAGLWMCHDALHVAQSK